MGKSLYLSQRGNGIYMGVVATGEDMHFLVRVCELHDEARSHVEERKGACNLLVLE